MWMIKTYLAEDKGDNVEVAFHQSQTSMKKDVYELRILF